jgi:RimJ/RimL family protein N-acetyltransferase
MVAKTLKTARLTIEPMTDAHCTDRLIGWLNDKALMRYSEQRHQQHTVATQRFYIRRAREEHILLWAIKHAAGNNMVGTISAHIDEINKRADMGVLIGGQYGGCGYATEAWTAVMTWLLNDRVRKVEAGAMADNGQMIRIMQKVGMRYEGCRIAHFWREGRAIDLAQYGMFAPNVAAPSMSVQRRLKLRVA